MAEIFPKTVVTSPGIDNTLILGVREALKYNFFFKDWTRVRLGVFISYTSIGAPNASFTPTVDQYAVDIVTDRDLYYIGLKDSSNNFPRENKSRFMGLLSDNTENESWSFREIGASDNAGLDSQRGDGGVVKSNGTYDTAGFVPNVTIVDIDKTDDTTEYCGFIGLEFTILNKNQSNQQVKIQQKIFFGESDTSSSAMRDNLFSNFTNLVHTADWNVSGIPEKLPDSVFIYFPANGERARIHSVGLFKFE